MVGIMLDGCILRQIGFASITAILLSIAPTNCLAQSLKEDQCISYDALLEIAKQEGQFGVVSGNVLRITPVNLETTYSVSGSPTTGKNISEQLERLSTPWGYKDFVDTLVSEQKISKNKARERLDNLRLALEGAYREASPRDGGFRVTFTSNNDGSYGYVLASDKPMGVKPTRYCVKFLLRDVALYDFKSNSVPASLKSEGRIQRQVQFDHLMGFGTTYMGYRRGKVWVLTLGAGANGYLYAGDQSNSERAAMLEKVEYGANTPSMLSLGILKEQTITLGNGEKARASDIVKALDKILDNWDESYEEIKRLEKK